jgi:hypothetical protein
MARMTRPDFSLSATAIISNKAAGTICHEAPEFVLQPAALLRPFIAAFAQFVPIVIELGLRLASHYKGNRSVNVKRGPPLSAVKSWPSSEKLTDITDPSGLP